MICLEQRNHFSVGEDLEFVLPKGKNIPFTVKALYNEMGEEIEKAPHAQMTVYLPYDQKMEPMTILRRKKNGA
jgi:putative protease